MLCPQARADAQCPSKSSARSLTYQDRRWLRARVYDRDGHRGLYRVATEPPAVSDASKCCVSAFSLSIRNCFNNPCQTIYSRLPVKTASEVDEANILQMQGGG